MSGADCQSDRSGRLVTVARASSLQEADLVRAVLGTAGIECFVQGELSANVLTHIGLGLNPGGIQVLIRECDAGRAGRILSAERLGELAPATGAEEGAVPKPGTRARLSREEMAGRAFLSMVAAVVFFAPLVVAAVYYWVRALTGDRDAPLRRPRRFRLHLIATVLVVVLVLCAVLADEIPFYWSLLLSLLCSPTGA